MADSLIDTIPQDNNDSQQHSQALPQQTNELNKNTTHTSSEAYIDGGLGDEQYSIDSKKTSISQEWLVIESCRRLLESHFYRSVDWCTLFAPILVN